MLISVLLVLCGCASPGSQSSAAQKVPNVVLVVAEDIGYGDLGCYGQKLIRTPNLDRLASEGVRFNQFYSGSAIATASRAVLMTGKHTGHATIRGTNPEQYPLSSSDLTLGEIMKSAGCTNGAIGVWSLGSEASGSTPNKRGFEEWFGYLSDQHAAQYYPEFLWRNEGVIALEDNVKGKRGTFAPDYFTLASTNFIRINAAAPYRPNQRFFLYLSTPLARVGAGNVMEIPSTFPYSAEGWSQAEKNKAATISHLDAAVGLLIKALESVNATTNTVFIFTSSNGPHKEDGTDPRFFKSTGGLKGMKRELYEGGIRVPLIIWAPGLIKGGTVSETPAAAWDILPTITQLAGVAAPKDIDGRSLVPTFSGREEPAGRKFYWELHEGGFQQAARIGAWKGIRTAPGKPLELYNIEDDPSESADMAARKPAIVAELEAYLKSARSESERWPMPKK